MTTNVPLSRTPAGRGSLLCESGPIHVVSFYLITKHNSLLKKKKKKKKLYISGIFPGTFLQLFDIFRDKQIRELHSPWNALALQVSR